MPLCTKTMELAAQFNVPQDQIDYFVKAGLTSFGDIALLATEEKEMVPEILAPMIASQVASAKELLGKIAMKKWWEA